MNTHLPYNSRPAWMVFVGGIATAVVAPMAVSVFTTAFAGLIDLIDRGVTLAVQVIGSIPW